MGITLGDVRGAHGCHGCVCHRLFFVLHGIAPMASLLTTPRPTLLALAVTALLIAVFIGGWAWAWSPRRRDTFDAAARLPLQEDSEEGETR